MIQYGITYGIYVDWLSWVCMHVRMLQAISQMHWGAPLIPCKPYGKLPIATICGVNWVSEWRPAVSPAQFYGRGSTSMCGAFSPYPVLLIHQNIDVRTYGATRCLRLSWLLQMCPAAGVSIGVAKSYACVACRSLPASGLFASEVRCLLNTDAKPAEQNESVVFVCSACHS